MPSYKQGCFAETPAEFLGLDAPFDRTAGAREAHLPLGKTGEDILGTGLPLPLVGDPVGESASLPSR